MSVNLRAVAEAEIEADSAWADIMAQREIAASLLRTTAPLRIYIRQFGPRERSTLFDVNMEPVCDALYLSDLILLASMCSWRACGL